MFNFCFTYACSTLRFLFGHKVPGLEYCLYSFVSLDLITALPLTLLFVLFWPPLDRAVMKYSSLTHVSGRILITILRKIIYIVIRRISSKTSTYQPSVLLRFVTGETLILNSTKLYLVQLPILSLDLTLRPSLFLASKIIVIETSYSFLAMKSDDTSLSFLFYRRICIMSTFL